VTRQSSETLDLDEYAAAILTTLGIQVRELRNEHGWTQRELAERAGVHVNVIGSIERGRSAMRISTLVEICRALQTTCDGLIGETERRVKAEGLPRVRPDA
jgi:XRE family transcriptional regulator, regulator of sulfur utilization